MAQTEATTEVQKDTAEAASRLAKSIGDAQAKIQKKADGKAKTNVEAPTDLDKKRDERFALPADTVTKIIKKVVDEKAKENFLNRTAAAKDAKEDKITENLVKENEKATTSEDKNRGGYWNGARNLLGFKPVVDPQEPLQGIPSPYARHLHRANEVLGRMLHRVHWQSRLKTLTDEEAQRVGSVIDVSILNLGNQNPSDLWAVNSAFLLKAYADHIVKKLSKSELAVLVHSFESMLRSIVGVTGNHHHRKQGLARYIGTPEDPYHEMDLATTSAQRELETRMDSELWNEINALRYAEANHLLRADIFEYLTGAHGHTPLSLYMPPDVRTSGEIFKIASGPMGQTTDVSTGAINTLRAYIGHKKRVMNLLGDLMMNAPSSLRNAFDMAAMQLYPVVKVNGISFDQPAGFGAYFSYPFIANYHRSVHVCDLLIAFLAELTNALRPKSADHSGETGLQDYPGGVD